MKKFYTTPELEVTELLLEEILKTSEDPSLDDEVEMDPDDNENFWN